MGGGGGGGVGRGGGWGGWGGVGVGWGGVGGGGGGVMALATTYGHCTTARFRRARSATTIKNRSPKLDNLPRTRAGWPDTSRMQDAPIRRMLDVFERSD